MSTYNLFYIGVLGNVNHTILSIDFGNDFFVEERERNEVVNFLATIEHVAANEIDSRLFDAGYKSNDQTVYLLVKKFVWPYTLSSQITEPQSIEEVFSKIGEGMKAMKKQSDYVGDVIRKLRLWHEGSIKVFLECYYSYSNEQLCMETMSMEGVHGANRLYEVNSSEASCINDFLRKELPSPLKEYIQLSLEHFELSYRVWPTGLEFITLMIVMEVLFNDSNTELNYRISRGCAVLLGTSIEDSQKIFKDMKRLYSKRSKLMHTGNRKSITDEDVLLLKKYVREALRRILVLNLEKSQLSQQLLVCGFGEHEKIQ